MTWKERAGRFAWPLANRRLQKTFVGTLLVTLLAKGMVLLPAYSIDDYATLLSDEKTHLMLEQGRFGQLLLLKALYALQLHPLAAAWFWALCALLAFSGLGVLVARFLGIAGSPWLALFAASMVANHPYTVEIFTFRGALGAVVPAYVLLGVALLPRRVTVRTAPGVVVALALAFSIYQSTVNYAVMIGLVGLPLWIARALRRAQRRGGSGTVRLRSVLTSPPSVLLACTFTAGVVYAVVNLLVTASNQVNMLGRTALLSWPGAPERVRRVVQILDYRLTEPGPLLAPLSQGLLIFLLVAAGATLVGVALRGRNRQALGLGSLALALFVLAVTWIVGVSMVLAELWPTPRVLAQAGVLFAGALAIAWTSGGRWLRALLAPAAALLLLASIGSSNRVLTDQMRVNRRDAALANRIAGRLEAMPGFSEIETIVYPERPWRYSLPLETDHDMNISAFGSDVAQLGLPRELTGYPLRSPTPNERAAAETYCASAPAWPLREAVTIRGRVAIVCLELP